MVSLGLGYFPAHVHREILPVSHQWGAFKFISKRIRPFSRLTFERDVTTCGAHFLGKAWAVRFQGPLMLAPPASRGPLLPRSSCRGPQWSTRPSPHASRPGICSACVRVALSPHPRLPLCPTPFLLTRPGSALCRTDDIRPEKHLCRCSRGIWHNWLLRLFLSIYF